MTEHLTSLRAASVPERPSLDGLEDKWAARMEGRGHLRLRPGAALAGPREEVFSIDTPPPTVCGSLHIGPRLHLHPHRLHRPLPADGGPTSSTRWAGTTTACPPSAGCRTTTACAATRRCPTTPTSTAVRATPRRQGRRQVPISRPNFIELCERARPCEDEEAFEALWRTLGLSRRLVASPTRTIGDRLARPSPAGVPAQPRPRRGLPARRRRRLWDVTFQTAVAQAELEAREYPGAYHRVAFHRPDGEPVLHRDHPPRADPGVRRADRPPRRRALPAAVRHHGHHAAVRRRGARCSRTRPPRPTRAPASRCAAPSATSPTCTWWRELQLPARTVIGRDGRLHARDARVARRPSRPRRRTPSSPARRRSRAREAMVDAAARDAATSTASRRRPSGWRTSTRRATSRSRSSPRASGTSATAAATPTLRAAAASPAASEIDLHPGLHAAPLRELGRRPQRRLADLAASASSACRSRSGTRSTPTASPTTTTRSCPREADAAGRPVDRRRRPGYTEDQRGKPGGFVGDPDVMDTWATSSLTPQIAGGWDDRRRPVRSGSSRWTCARRRTTSSAPGCSPRVVRAHFEHGTRAVVATPRSSAGSSTPTARR